MFSHNWYKEWKKEFDLAIEDYQDVLNFFYLDYANFPGEEYNYEKFKESILSVTADNLDYLHDKYADHIEGLRKSKIKNKKGK